MAKEQQLLGDWKIEKIVEAAGNDFDEEMSHDNLMRILRNGYSYDSDEENIDNNSSSISIDGIDTHSPSPIVTLFSFVDCPWCLLAKQLLQEGEEYRQLLLLDNDDALLQIIELEELGQEGKHLRASIALATGRTSMPACFIGGKSVGGYTDGFSTDDDDNDVNLDEGRRMSEGFMFVPRPEVDLRMMESKGLASLHEKGELKRLISGTRCCHRG